MSPPKRLALASARAQIEALNGIIADDERNVGLVQAAITSGSGTQVQLVSAQSQLAEDRALLPDLRQQEAVARHALAILVGKAPAEWSPPVFALTDFTLTGELPVSLPSVLVRCCFVFRVVVLLLRPAHAGGRHRWKAPAAGRRYRR